MIGVPADAASSNMQAPSRPLERDMKRLGLCRNLPRQSRSRMCVLVLLLGAGAACGGVRAAGLARPASDVQPSFRILQWNVSDTAWVKRADAARAVIRHADPDILVLDEVGGVLGAAGVRQMLSGIRGASDTIWFISFGVSGGYQHTVIASRDSVRQLPEFALVPFPDTGRAAALAAVPDTVSGHPTRAEAVSVGTNGAMVRVRGKWLLVVGMDLTCCGTPGSWRDYRRQVEAVSIRERVRTVLARMSPEGVIAAGDMNLVTGRAPLDSLLSAISGARLGPMRVAEPVQPDGWTTWTWDGRGTAFNGARLDAVTYSAGALTPFRARIWDTEFMTPDTLQAHHLTAATSASINRHRPIVVDFRFVVR